jgi:RNA polymerase subunit RPABC4/transcription elongation factor Spt4
MSELLTAPEWNRMPLIASERNAATPHRLGRKRDSSQGIGMKCRNPSLRPNEMSELLTAPEWNGMLIIASGRNVTTPHRLGRKRDAPQSIGVKDRNSPLRPNETSELLTAPEWNGMLLIASERSVTTPHRLGRNGMRLIASE